MKNMVMLMPVVDDEDHMIGVIAVDDILEIMVEETTEDIHRMGELIKRGEGGWLYQKDSIKIQTALAGGEPDYGAACQCGD